jgi:hypothetical protein
MFIYVTTPVRRALQMCVSATPPPGGLVALLANEFANIAEQAARLRVCGGSSSDEED